MARIVVVEDDTTIGKRLSEALRGLGHVVDWCPNGTAALELPVHETANLLLVDLGLPDVDGFALCRELRELVPDGVLVVLTARTDEMDVIEALEAGADDYLTKPFRLAELQARITAHLRRSAQHSGGGNRVQVGELVVDAAVRRCIVAGTEIPLRPKEFDLLARLALSAGQALSRETLMSDVWDENWFGSTKTLDVHVAALRRKLGDSVRIETLRHFGYRLESPCR